MAVSDLDVFLSHRYRAAEINLGVFDAVERVAHLRFHVDRGLTSTSPPRLERMIRGRDGFVGIYAVAGDARDVPSYDELWESAQYFRLELDMAVRARKPMLLFVDRRFGEALPLPHDAIVQSFDAQEIEAGPGSGLRHDIETRVRQFAEACEARRPAAIRDLQPTVGLLLPEDPDRPAHLALVSDLVRGVGFRPYDLGWPFSTGLLGLRALSRCDWVVVDDSTPETHFLVAFLRGRGVPFVRFRAAGSLAPPGADALFGDLADRYRRNVVVWATEDELRERLRVALSLVVSPSPTLIADRRKAQEYFRSAALRKEAVFLSYSGRDEASVAELDAELRRRFTDVFNFRERGALPHGGQWFADLVAQLSRAAVGVAVVSESYAASSYCMDEIRRMSVARLDGRLTLFPVLLDGTELDEISPLQRVRLGRLGPREIVDDIVARLDGRQNAFEAPWS